MDFRVDIIEDDDTSKDYNPLALAAALENKSSHPVANAIVSGII
jgi:cation transport ATPase